jgi:hypothetical protein
MMIVLDENIDKAVVDALLWQKKYAYGVVLLRLDDIFQSFTKANIVLAALHAHGAQMSGAITSITSKFFN